MAWNGLLSYTFNGDLAELSGTAGTMDSPYSIPNESRGATGFYYAGSVWLWETLRQPSGPNNYDLSWESIFTNVNAIRKRADPGNVAGRTSLEKIEASIWDQGPTGATRSNSNVMGGIWIGNGLKDTLRFGPGNGSGATQLRCESMMNTFGNYAVGSFVNISNPSSVNPLVLRIYMNHHPTETFTFEDSPISGEITMAPQDIYMYYSTNGGTTYSLYFNTNMSTNTVFNFGGKGMYNTSMDHGIFLRGKWNGVVGQVTEAETKFFYYTIYYDYEPDAIVCPNGLNTIIPNNFVDPNFTNNDTKNLPYQHKSPTIDSDDNHCGVITVPQVLAVPGYHLRKK